MQAPVEVRSPAGFWKRYVAYTIDVIIVSLGLQVLTPLLFAGVGSSELERLRPLMESVQNGQPLPTDPSVLLAAVPALLWKLTLASTLAYILVGGAYFALFESSSWQATPGKRMVGIQVVANDGSRLGRGRAFARFFAAALSWLTLNLGHVLAGLKPEYRALHDYVAGTRVENADPAHPELPAWGWIVIGLQALLLVVLVFGMAALVLFTLNQASQV